MKGAPCAECGTPEFYLHKPDCPLLARVLAQSQPPRTCVCGLGESYPHACGTVPAREDAGGVFGDWEDRDLADFAPEGPPRTYGDIAGATAAFSMREMLDKARPLLAMERFARPVMRPLRWWERVLIKLRLMKPPFFSLADRPRYPPADTPGLVRFRRPPPFNRRDYMDPFGEAFRERAGQHPAVMVKSYLDGAEMMLREAEAEYAKLEARLPILRDHAASLKHLYDEISRIAEEDGNEIDEQEAAREFAERHPVDDSPGAEARAAMPENPELGPGRYA
jgi:hypothetical protein